MSVTEARVEADGWTLSVTGTWPASTWADFQLDPDGARRVRVTVSGPGHDRLGNEAVFNPARLRETVSHQVRPDRYPDWPQAPQFSGFGPWPGYAPLNRPLGEVDNGDGTRTIRLMLHEPVIAGEVVSLTLAAGWRTGLPAQTLAVANHSVEIMPLPIVRWVSVPYQAVRGSPEAPATSFMVELLGGHVMPEGRSGLCAVRICATDGLSRRLTWLSVGTSEDGLRCWRGHVDLSGLNPGPVALHWSVYPWFGTARHSSEADPTLVAPSVLHPGASSATAGFGAAAQTPLMIGFDPVGSRYGYTTQASYGPAPSTYFRYVCVAVDPGGQSSAPADRTAAEAMCGFGNTPEAAKAAALTATRAASSSVALTALRRLARNLPAANGAPATSNSADGMIIHFVDGLHVAGTGSIPSGDAIGETWPILEGNGADVCTVRSASSGTNRLSYGGWALRRNLRLESGPLVLGGVRGWFDRCEIHDQAGHSSTLYSSSAPSAGEVRWYMTGGRHAMASFAYGHANNASGLYRNVQFRRQLAGPVIVNCRKTDALTKSTPLDSYNLGSGSQSSCFEDVILWGNDCRGVDGGIVWGFQLGSTLGEDGRRKIRRQMVVNNVFERMSGDDGPCWKVGENSNPELDAENCIIEGNSAIGDRANHFYNEPQNFNLNDTFTKFNSYKMNRVANNYVDRWASKHDVFFDSTVSSLRAALGSDDGNRGRRGHLIQGWQIRFGHMHEANVEAHRIVSGVIGSGSGVENHGVSAVLAPNPSPADNASWPRFRDDRSALGSGQGFGDYRPLKDAPWRLAAWRAQVDADHAGVLRGARFASGAFEPLAAPETAPETARHAHSATSPGLATGGNTVALTIAGARHTQGATSPGLAGDGVAASLAIALGRHAHVGASIALGFEGQAGSADRAFRTVRVAPESRLYRPQGD